VATGKTAAKIQAKAGNVDGAAFTPDDRILAVTKGRENHRKNLWNFAAIAEGEK